MVKKGNIHGGENQTNINGFNFEKKVSLKQAIRKHPQLSLKKGNKVYKGEKFIGLIFEAKGNQNNSFYAFLKSEFGINGKEEISKTINPDKRFYVIECKYQERTGSVDEKLQTFVFKKAVLNYLLFKDRKAEGVDLEYFYVLNKKHFGQKTKNGKEKYHEVFKFIRENGSNYYFDIIPLSKLGIY